MTKLNSMWMVVDVKNEVVMLAQATVAVKAEGA
jgi:hypothetical protein